jgi:hypothetical protein
MYVEAWLLRFFFVELRKKVVYVTLYIVSAAKAHAGVINNLPSVS